MNIWAAGYYVYGVSALFKPMASDLGFSRTVMSVPTAIGRLEGGFEGPLSGWATDRFGPKWPVFLGVFIVGLSLILLNFIHSLWAFYVVWGIMLGTGFNIFSSIPVDTSITNWFVKKRGLALGIKKVLDGLSGVLTLPLVAWLIITQGWRKTCTIGGVVMWVVGLPLAWFCFRRHRPEYYGLLPDGTTEEEEAAETDQMIDKGVKYAAEVEEVEFTLRQAMKTPAYWLLIAAHCVHGLVSGALNVHLVPFLTDIGIDPLKAAGMMSIMVASSIPGRVIGGFMTDRIRKSHLRFLVGGTYLMQAAGFGLFLLNQTKAMIYPWLIVYGIAMGASYLYIAMVARYFGRKAFGSINGTKMMFMTPFSVVAPIYAGWVYDTTGSYISAFVVFAAVLVFAGCLMCLVRPPKPPAQVTDVRKIV